MTTQRPVKVSVIDPIGPAIDRVKTILFSPFDIGKWFIIGFCAWLAQLGTAGGKGSTGGRGGGNGGGDGYSSIQEFLVQAKEYALANLSWILPLVIAGVVISIIFWFIFAWLNSRGQFMFLHCVALNKAEVTVPWRKFRQHANSLFIFRIVVGLISFIIVWLPLLIAIGFILMMLTNEGVIVIGALTGITIGVIILSGAIIFHLISTFTKDFVVPIMFLRTSSCNTGWQEFIKILAVNKGRFILYILFQIVIGLVIGTITMIGFCVTCCFCCLGLLPYISTVILLPLLVFKRSYSLLYLRQYGPQFDVFCEETENLHTI